MNVLLRNNNVITENLDPLKSLLNAQGLPYLTLGEIEALNWELREVKYIIEGINLDQGYVENINIFNEKLYPIVAQYAAKFSTRSSWYNLDSNNKAKVYKWITQALLMNLLTWTNKGINSLEHLKNTNGVESHVYNIMFAFLTVYRDWVISFLDNSIKQHLKIKRVKIFEDMYAGFDTEYITKDLYKNELVSFQLSINSALKIIIPVRRIFDFESIDTLTSKRYHKDAPKVINEDVLRTMFQDSIHWNQEEMYKGYWDRIEVIKYNLLHSNIGIRNVYNDDEKFMIQGTQTPIKNLVFVAKPGEKLEINFDGITNIITANVDRIGPNLIKEIVKPYSDIIESSVVLNEGSWNSKTMKTEEPVYLNWSNADNNQEFPVEKVYKNKDINYSERIYLLAHYNAADLTMIKDWKKVSYKNIDILKKGYASLVRPLKSLGKSVFIRDTLSLSSAAAGSLDAVGKAHGLKKVAIDAKWYLKMDEFLEREPLEFIKYASEDSLITLIHGLFMNDFAFKIGNHKLPITLGSLSSKYVELKWKEDGYKGYQINHEFPIGDAQITHTPKGIAALGRTGDYLNGYLGSFRGGRNECFAYGIDKDTRWYDYDLTSCYSTIMSMLGDPDYERIETLEGETVGREVEEIVEGDPRIAADSSSIMGAQKNIFVPSSTIIGAQKNNISHEANRLGSYNAPYNLGLELGPESKVPPMDILSLCGDPDYANQSSLTQKNVNDFDFKKGYSALRVVFKFPPKYVDYPPIPVSLDKNITIYPLSGESLITGLEYESALNILEMAKIMCQSDDDNLLSLNAFTEKYYIRVISGSYIPFKDEMPFFNVINDLQRNRKLHPKKSAMERIYKDLGNMLYGKVVCGISNKRKFDSRIMLMKSMTGSYLSNPIIGAWITGFVRALLAELLFGVTVLKGKVTAVTTDGFVTDIPDLENKLFSLFIDMGIYDISFLKSYRDIRMKLSNCPDSLEVKTNVRGIIQWTTRGQISLDSSDTGVPIAAMTGFQKYHFTHDENIKSVTDALNSRNKILFLQKRLSGSLDFVKNARHVSMVDSLRQFRTVFDSKRLVVPDTEETMLFTRPYRHASDAILYRGLLNQLRQSIYNQGHAYNSFNRASIVHETIKLFIRTVASVFHFNMDMTQKNFIVNVLRDSDLGLKMDEIYILKLIAFVELNPGIVKNTITIMKANYTFVHKLLDCINANYSSNKYHKNILSALKTSFSNFGC